MKIRFLRDPGGEFAAFKKDEIVTLDDAIARTLVGLGFATRTDAPVSPPPLPAAPPDPASGAYKMGGVVDTVAPTRTAGTVSPLSIDINGRVRTRVLAGIDPTSAFVSTLAFAAGNTAGAGGTNATVKQVLPANLQREYFHIENNGPADIELWFGALPADALVGKTPPRGIVIASGGGRVWDVKVPRGAIYVTCATAGGICTYLEG